MKGRWRWWRGRWLRVHWRRWRLDGLVRFNAAVADHGLAVPEEGVVLVLIGGNVL